MLNAITMALQCLQDEQWHQQVLQQVHVPCDDTVMTLASLLFFQLVIFISFGIFFIRNFNEFRLKTRRTNGRSNENIGPPPGRD